MSDLTTWVKEDKTEIKLNDNPATVAKAESLGWKRKAGRKPSAEKAEAK